MWRRRRSPCYGRSCGQTGRAALILQYDVQRVDDARDVTQDRQQDVDKEVGAAASLQEDADGREDDREDNLADIASCERHLGGCVRV